MKYRSLCGFVFGLGVVLFWSATSFAQTSSEAKALLKKVASRKGALGFSARFYQESPLKAIGIVETASGKVWFKKPGMVRWEYEAPEPMAYISDGEILWIHSPEGNQVWRGDADAFFGESGGARFLSDVTTITERFSMTLEGKEEGAVKAVLLPLKENDDLKEVTLFIDPATFDIVKVRSVRVTGEETTLSFSAIRAEVPKADFFEFTPPEGAVVTPLQ